MRLVVQRVSRAEVRVDNEVISCIGPGLLLLLGVEKDDHEDQLDALAGKVLNMRIFEDSAGKMNLSALDTGAGIMVVSQFTLAADLSRGRRPGFERAAPPGVAEVLYEAFVERLRGSGLTVVTGRFGAYMEVDFINDGPVTFVVDGMAR